MQKYSIGVFDSGFGGLAVFKEISKALPQYNYIYLGDTANCPYGNRSQTQIYQFTQQAVDFLFSQNCFLVILACNTSSCLALHIIQQEYLFKNYPSRRVLGVVVPASEEAALLTKNMKIGVIATKATVSSLAFKRELTKLNPKIKVFQQACPLLVPLIEQGKHNASETKTLLQKYLKRILKEGIDTLILGCTHYGLLEKQIQHFGNDRLQNVEVVSEGKITAKKLKDYLLRHPEIETKLAIESKLSFLTTGKVVKFKKLASLFYGKEILPKKVKLNCL
ncbi:glutamate racemase [bacterium (Candidatus Gribaldobacteria) CG10_big_fil_rev_8_21_14_0_10_37_21]|uniref:Glutamate racemase n=1 Tax=bacterium (Candidatus Gribaldobacteria) CG10_big_fil_rev_8_21_14_0_10_37_21 TaxID=2014275 RepID=A0A2H0UUT4_9BACT|nr:MAG: glutamate racemase [Parcubacteria group bacterium CG1_02_37_13]PIR90577.1 MAG: glutamate racemase [bacterium (Candidatus Gribaldobacteria) CG10_big_fil_rev_8_21_14_0_10_37_21]